MATGDPAEHDYWCRQGPNYGDSNAVQFLFDRGFHLTREWEWTTTDGFDWLITDQEWRAISYLIDEWDFGGYRGAI